jgi:hypothetical protein
MSSSLATPRKLPPLWGNSNWWTRSGAIIGLASLLLGTVMTSLVSVHLGSCGLQNQMTSPTLAIEVAASWEDVLEIVGPCQALHCLQSKDANGCFAAGGDCKTVCPDKIQSLAFEQTMDYGFIVVYWLFFLYLGLINWLFCRWKRFGVLTQIIGKISGVATAVAASLGALADWRENGRILQALGNLHTMAGSVPPMRDIAYTKWRLLFLAIGLAAPIFVFWPGKNNNADTRRSAFSQTLAWTTAVLALSTAWTGVAASNYGDDHRLELAGNRLGFVIFAAMLTLATAQYWRGGTIAALDKLAKLPVLSFITNLFTGDKVESQTTDSDPSQML